MASGIEALGDYHTPGSNGYIWELEIGLQTKGTPTGHPLLLIGALVGCERQSDTVATEAGVSATDAGKELADSVYTHGKIYTVNKEQPWAEALIGESTEVVDLNGKRAEFWFLESII